MNRGAVLAFVALLAPTVARSETLQEAIALAYRTNPVLQGQRLSQQALDETYVQAGASLRPTASLTGSAYWERGPNDSLHFTEGTYTANAGQGGITFSQPLYTGGRTTWALRQADANIAAGREGLRSVEAQVIATVVTAYADVLQGQEAVAIRDADLKMLNRQVAEASARFKLGQATKTDVAQAEAQMEAAVAALAAAQAELEIAKAEYVAAVGRTPGDLVQPDVLSGLPPTLDEAFELAEAANPALRRSREQARSAAAAVGVAKSAFRPTISLTLNAGYIGPIAPLATRDYDQDVTAGVTVNVPLFTGGMNASQLRQARAQRDSAEMAEEATGRAAIQSVAIAWNQLLSNRAGVKAGEAQVTAAETALRGEEAEYGFGLRTTLDLLIVDENLRAAQLALAQSRHDTTLSEAALLAATGRLDIATLVPDQPVYDPRRHFEKVKDIADTPFEPIVRAVDRLGLSR
jgi:outer membrane protein